MIASGEVLRCSREENSDLFWATVGGMGLTGVILELELRMRRVESAYLDGELIRAGNVDAAIEAFERIDSVYGFSVAWIDCNSTKSALGRSLLIVGNSATLDQLPRNLARSAHHDAEAQPVPAGRSAGGEFSDRPRLQRALLLTSSRNPRILSSTGEFFLSARFPSGLDPDIRQARLRAVSVRVAAG